MSGSTPEKPHCGGVLALRGEGGGRRGGELSAGVKRGGPGAGARGEEGRETPLPGSIMSIFAPLPGKRGPPHARVAPNKTGVTGVSPLDYWRLHKARGLPNHTKDAPNTAGAPP